MATAALHHGGFGDRPVVPRLTQARPSTRWSVRRMWDALSRTRRRQAEAEIADYVQLRGGRITDALERDIERRFMFGRF
jgi:hypothetical protein